MIGGDLAGEKTTCARVLCFLFYDADLRQANKNPLRISPAYDFASSLLLASRRTAAWLARGAGRFYWRAKSTQKVCKSESRGGGGRCAVRPTSYKNQPRTHHTETQAHQPPRQREPMRSSAPGVCQEFSFFLLFCSSSLGTRAVLSSVIGPLFLGPKAKAKKSTDRISSARPLLGFAPHIYPAFITYNHCEQFRALAYFKLFYKHACMHICIIARYNSHAHPQSHKTKNRYIYTQKYIRKCEHINSCNHQFYYALPKILRFLAVYYFLL